MAYLTGRLLIFSDTSTDYTIVDPDYRKFTSYSITLGNNANYLAVWAEPKSAIDSGKFQIATNEGLFIIDLEKKILYDRYTTTLKGRSNDFLLDEDVEDISLGG